MAIYRSHLLPNAGERAVERHGGVPQYAKSYLEKVLSHY